MKKMKVWSTVLATGVALTTLAACSGGSNSTTASSSEEKADKSQELVIYSNSVSNGRGDWLTAKAKEAGKMRVEGKEYIVKDGDIMHFRFNV